MSEWSIALIASGSALAGSLVTGWFTRSAGTRQADAARHAGDRQADALLSTVRMTLEREHLLRLVDQRRQTYVRFLETAAAVLGQAGSRSGPDERPALHRALDTVILEGPDEVAAAARDFVGALRTNRPLDDLDRLRREFIEVARDALGGLHDLPSDLRGTPAS